MNRGVTEVAPELNQRGQFRLLGLASKDAAAKLGFHMDDAGDVRIELRPRTVLAVPLPARQLEHPEACERARIEEATERRLVDAAKLLAPLQVPFSVGEEPLVFV